VVIIFRIFLILAPWTTATVISKGMAWDDLTALANALSVNFNNHNEIFFLYSLNACIKSYNTFGKIQMI